MYRLFNPENPFWMFMEKIMNVFIISFLWLLFSIPVITIGAATTALFQFTLKMAADEEGYVCRSFIKGFIGNFRQATAVWLTALSAGVLLVFDLYLSRRLIVHHIAGNMVFFAIISILIIYLLTCMYLFPILAFYHTGFCKLMRDGLIMAMGNLPVSVIILAIYGIAGAAAYFAPPLFFLFFGAACFASSYFYRWVLCRYIERPE